MRQKCASILSGIERRSPSGDKKIARVAHSNLDFFWEFEFGFMFSL
jgi:hypothetical protein